MHSAPGATLTGGEQVSEETTSTVSLVGYILKIKYSIVKIKLIYTGNLVVTTLQRLRYQMLIFEADTDQRT